MRFTIDGKETDVSSQPNKKYFDPSDSQEIDIHKATEIGDSMREINSDKLSKTGKMSDIDFKSRLNFVALPSIVALDSLHYMQCYPATINNITKTYKRNVVSLNGMGRKELVDIATAGVQRSSDSNTGSSFFSKLTGIFKKGETQ